MNRKFLDNSVVLAIDFFLNIFTSNSYSSTTKIALSWRLQRPSMHDPQGSKNDLLYSERIQNKHLMIIFLTFVNTVDCMGSEWRITLASCHDCKVHNSGFKKNQICKFRKCSKFSFIVILLFLLVILLMLFLSSNLKINVCYIYQ